MLAQERQQRILTLLDERGTVRTIDLAEEFAVTDETIRRDLQMLEESRQLTRIHGGASTVSGRPKLQSFSERRNLEIAKKQQIAQTAIELIEPGKTYAFDSSTTAFILVSLLPDLPYRVLTNAYAVLDNLVHKQNIDLISTGGRYDPKTQTFFSSDSHTALRRYHIHTAFISCAGLDPDRGASEAVDQVATFREILVQIAEQVVLLVDSTKLGKRAEYYFADVPNLSLVITDHEADPAIVGRLKMQGCNVRIAPPAFDK